MENLNQRSYRHLQVLCRYCQSASSRLSVKEQKKKKTNKITNTLEGLGSAIFVILLPVETEIAIIINENLKVLTSSNRLSKKNHNKEPFSLPRRTSA